MTKIKLSILLAFAISCQLNANDVELDKLTVTTPTKFPQSLENTTANVDVITSDEIKERGYKSISDALKAQSGILYTRNGGLGKATSIMLRGFDSKRTLVLVDGVRYNDPASLSGAHFEHILMENIERIEIVKGAQSGIWGADASAGVINIITKSTTQDGFTASINAEYGSFNTQTYGFNTGYRLDKFNISLNAQRLSTDGFSAKVPEGKKAKDFEDDQYENSSAAIKLGYNFTDNDRVETFFNYIDADSDFDGYNADATLAANDSIANSSIKEKVYGVSYKNQQAKNSTKIYFNKSDFTRVSTSSFGESKFDGSVDEFGLNTSYDYITDASLNIGLDYKKFKHKNDISRSSQNQGIFISNSNKFSSMVFNQSIRFDEFDKFKNKLTYKVGLKYIDTNTEDFWISANYATAYNVPSLFQLYSYAGDENLIPEETKGFDVTVNFKGLGVTYFYNTINDLIDYDNTTFKYSNLSGKTKLSGVEASYNQTIEAIDTMLNINYTHLKTEDKDGKELERRAKNIVNLSLDFYGISGARIGSSLQYVGKRKKSQYDSNPEIDYEAYTVADLSADYDITNQLNIYAKIDNVLDEDYQTITGYATSQRAYYLGFRYKVK